MGSPLYTVGYGNRDLDVLLAQLQHYGVQILVDVRSAPFSRHRPEFSKRPLQRAVRMQGMRYWFRGKTLGGMPRDRSLYEGGQLIVERLRARGDYRQDIHRLQCAAAMGGVLCLLCSEEDPRRCHRSRILGADLARAGIGVRHLLADGGYLAQDELGFPAEQLSLFAAH